MRTSLSVVVKSIVPGIALIAILMFSQGSARADACTTGGGLEGPVRLMGNVLAVHSVPEPATLMLLGVGLLGVAGVVRRRMKRRRPPADDE